MLRKRKIMADGKTINISEVLNNPKYRAIGSTDPIVVTPTEWHKNNKVPVGRRWGVKIKPISGTARRVAASYHEIAVYEMSLECALSKLGLNLPDLYNGMNTADIVALPADKRITEANPDIWEKVMHQIENNIDGRRKVNELNYQRDLEAVKSSVVSVVLGDDEMVIDDSFCANLNGDLFNWLIGECKAASNLTSDEEIAFS